MSVLRSAVAFVAISVLSMPLASCSEAQADDVLEQLYGALMNLQQQRRYDFLNDPLNRFYDRAQDARQYWPPGVPRPVPGTAPDWYGPGGGTWNGGKPGDGDAYRDQLTGDGWETVAGPTTETDPVTGWETTTTTHRNDSGQEIVVKSTDTGVGGERISVDTTSSSQ